MSSFDESGAMVIEPGRNVLCVGSKGSGKSILALSLARSYPHDLVTIDVAADDGPMRDSVRTIHGQGEAIPNAWPRTWDLAQRARGHENRRQIIRFVPNTRQHERPFLADCDRAVQLALSRGDQRGHCGLLIHEYGLIAPTGRTQPGMREALNSGRHHGLNLILCCPRPSGVDLQAIHQSDVIYVFNLPLAHDRARIAEGGGIDKDRFETAYRQLREHEYLRYDARAPKDSEEALLIFDALPSKFVEGVERWSRQRAQRA